MQVITVEAFDSFVNIAFNVVTCGGSSCKRALQTRKQWIAVRLLAENAKEVLQHNLNIYSMIINCLCKDGMAEEAPNIFSQMISNEFN